MAPKKSKVPSFAQVILGVGKDVVGTEMCYDALDHKNRLTGIPIEPISLQWLINSNIWPVNRVTQSGGAPKTKKSTFSQWLATNFLRHGGIVVILDTEGKLSGETIEDLIGDRDLVARYRDRNNYILMQPRVLEDWQSVIFNTISEYEKHKKRDELPPTLFIVDSLQGVNSADADEELADSGHGVGQSRAGQLAAKQIHQFMRGIGNRLNRVPIGIHIVSKELPGENYAKVRGGGLASDFQCVLDLQFRTGGTSAYNNSLATEPGAGKHGSIIRMSMRYSAIGPDTKDREITVPVIHRYVTDPETGRSHVAQFYDWGAADAHFLYQRRERIKRTFHIDGKYVKGYGLKCWSDTLGIKEKDALFASAFGLIVQGNPEVMEALQNEMFITYHAPLPLNADALADRKFLETRARSEQEK